MGKKLKYESNVDPVANYSLLIRATFLALKNTENDSLSVEEIEQEVIDILGLTKKQVERRYKDQPEPELRYRLGVARNYLQKCGLLDCDKSILIWFLTEDGDDIDELTEDEAVEIYETASHGYDEDIEEEENQKEIIVDPLNLDEKTFKEQLLYKIKHMDPFDFERLTVDLLTECGFSDVVRTPDSKDGGIDGKGKLIIPGVGTLQMVFQCKKFNNWVVKVDTMKAFIGSKDFENASIKIFVTTNAFSQDSIERAKEKDVVLIDGEKLVDLLIEHSVGCLKENVYTIDENYFENINDEEEK